MIEVSIAGIQRKTNKSVAIKVIDKLKFPSSKEAALRVEVEILQVGDDFQTSQSRRKRA